MKNVHTWGLGERLHREDAFTLLELTIVVVILGIILTVATLSAGNISRSINMSAAKRQIEAALNRAKTAARQENVSYQLIFYTDGSGSNPNTYEFLHNVENVDGTWTMTPVNRSVSGEKTTISGSHAYIEVGNKVKITGCTEIAGTAVVVKFTPSGTTMSVSGSDSGGGTSSATVTLNLSIGGQTGGVMITGEGTISTF
jgi:prepilin-type N-terminal cleavage/methylation domain-containing protein